MTRWKQCPYCARWFIANGRQIYCDPFMGLATTEMLADVAIQERMVLEVG